MGNVWIAGAIATSATAAIMLAAVFARSKERRDAAKEVLRIIFRVSDVGGRDMGQ